MKSRIKIVIAAAIVLFAACNKNLTVLPQNNITPDQIKTGADVEALLGGAYELMQGWGGFGEQFFIAPDLFANQDQVNFIGTFSGYRDLSDTSTLNTNPLALGIWQNSYDIINNVNTVMDKSYLITDTSERNVAIGDAEFIRGTIYFEMVNLFGLPYSAGNTTSNPGVPLVLKPTYNVDTISNYYVTRATVEQVYTQILNDLQDAAIKLPDVNSIKSTDANHYAAEAMLARVYMSMMNYPQAVAFSNDVIASGNYELMSTFSAEFNNASYSGEDVFDILQSVQSNTGTTNDGLTTFYDSYSSVFAAASPGARGDLTVDPNYKNYFTGADVRKSFFFKGGSIEGGSYLYTQKWMQFYKAIPVIRLAEMYLIRGEANLLAGTSIGASPAADINIVRNRSNASNISGPKDQDFIDEFFREFGFEGQRLWSLKRRKMDVNGLPFDNRKLIMPIPLPEMDVNPNLIQNPGY